MTAAEAETLVIDDVRAHLALYCEYADDVRREVALGMLTHIARNEPLAMLPVPADAASD